ncbi:MAG: Ig-like domain-containing protein [Tannerella sp.]|jgi:uncharacterized protein YjdB|nr:Ig-like domain-containing protein [Tannerella sp.]
MKEMITKKALLLFALSVFFAMGARAQVVTGVALLGADTITLGVGCDTTLVAIVLPHDAANKSVIWTPSNKLVVDTARVEDDTVCTITGISVGEAKIIVITKEGNYSDTCVVRVVVPVDSVRLKDDSLTLTLGHDTTLISKIYPRDPDVPPTNGSMEWTSSNPLVLEVLSVEDDSICSARAVEVGVATLYVTSADGKRDSCVFTVEALPVTDVALNIDSIKRMPLGSDTTLIARVFPLGEANDSIRWYSDDYAVVRVTTPGYDTIVTIRAVGEGEAHIFAVSMVDGTQKDSCYVKVVPVPVDSLYLNTDSLDLVIHTDTTLIASFTPRNVTNDSVIWTSRDSSVIDIISNPLNRYDTTCVIRAVGAGEGMIYAVSVEDGSCKDSCVVTVIVPVESVVLDSTAYHLNLKNDTTRVLKARLYPDSATWMRLKWRNFDESLAVIDSVPEAAGDTLCYIKALKAGVDTICVTTADGRWSDTCYVVIAPREVDSVRISKDDGRVVDDTLQLSANSRFELATAVYPANATNDSIRYSSSNVAILSLDTISDVVYIHARGEGTATVYALAADGSGEKDSCIVKVRNVPVTGIRLDRDTLRLYEQHEGILRASILPGDASDRSVAWRIGNPDAVELIPAEEDSIFRFKGLTVDTLLIHAFPGTFQGGNLADINIKDSCVVIIREQLIFVESDTAAAETGGVIRLYLKIPENGAVNGSFDLHLPKGFGLAFDGDKYKAALDAAYGASSVLNVTRQNNDSTYRFDVVLRPTSTAGTVSKKLVMEIPYTIYGSFTGEPTGLYDASVTDAAFRLGSNPEFRDDRQEFSIKYFHDPTGNEPVRGQERILAYVRDNRLYVNTGRAETVRVYLLNGRAVMAGEKAEGLAVFDVDVPDGILIVRGGSGWSRKVFAQ